MIIQRVSSVGMDRAVGSPAVRAAAISAIRKPLSVGEFPDPVPPTDGVVLRVEATGICRSDWHAWMGHEELPGLPHVPGHEMAGTVEAVGPEVATWRVGDRVTVPFSVGCGSCRSCQTGRLNTCDDPFTPGFTHWGSFAELVAIAHADINLVTLPDRVDFTHAAALGCRFITAFRAVVDQGRVGEGDWLVIHGCGGVGLSALMIGVARGARVVAVDIQQGTLDLASQLGAAATVDAGQADPISEILDVTDGGARVSIDALGTTTTAVNSIRSLRKHGRHIQVGLLLGDDAVPPIPMGPVIAGELEIVGSRGMAATDYPRVFQLIDSGQVEPGRLVTNTVSLDEASPVLEEMSRFTGVGMTVIDRFG